MKLLVRGALLGAALLLGAAGPPPAPSTFAKEPRLQDALALVSEAERSEGGFAAMRCKVTADARLADCRLVRESRPGGSFGKVLLGLAPEYRVRPASEGGPAPGSEIIETFNGLRFDKPVDWRRRPSAKDLLIV